MLFALIMTVRGIGVTGWGMGSRHAHDTELALGESDSGDCSSDADCQDTYRCDTDTSECTWCAECDANCAMDAEEIQEVFEVDTETYGTVGEFEYTQVNTTYGSDCEREGSNSVTTLTITSQHQATLSFDIEIRAKTLSSSPKTAWSYRGQINGLRPGERRELLEPVTDNPMSLGNLDFEIALVAIKQL